MKMIHYRNKIRSHLVTIAQIAPFTTKLTSKLTSALHFRYSIVTPRAEVMGTKLLDRDITRELKIHKMIEV